jgi:ABC-type transport system involved in multi-copper enzyme maturation permease subunit
MNPTLIIARLTFREAVRRKIVLTAILLGASFLIIYSIGFHLLSDQISQVSPTSVTDIASNEGHNLIFLMGLYAVTFLSIAMAALISADTLAGEINSGTIQSVVTKPIHRSDVVLGKWLGFATLLGLYLLLMAGGITLSLWLQSGYLAPHLLAGIALIYLESLLIMSVALMCSSRLSALATGAVVFGLYGLAFIGGWVEQFGSLFQSQTAINIGIITSLIIPSESLWRRAAYEMQSPLSGVLGISPFGTISVPSILMIVYAVVYLVAATALALRNFNRRDL